LDSLNRMMRGTSAELNVADGGNLSQMQEREFRLEINNGLTHGCGQVPVGILSLLGCWLEQAYHPLFLELLDFAIETASGFARFFGSFRRRL
jgi:hypothetical protein